MGVQKCSVYSGASRKVQRKYTEEEINIMVNKANDYMRAKPYRTRSRVANYLGVGPGTLIKWEKEGRLKLPEFNRYGVRNAKIIKAAVFMRALRKELIK
jgi:DNA-binding XRE family transcriptional regulator